MQKISIVVDVPGKDFKSSVQEKIVILEATPSYSWKNDKR